MLVLNDLHVGTKRQAGTTPASQAALTSFIIDRLDHLLHLTQESWIVVAGDLFDRFEVEAADLISAYTLFSSWLAADEARLLTLIAGNHDWAPKGSKISSFHLLAHFLVSRFGDRVDVIDHTRGFTVVGENVYAIAHMPNQDLFEIEVDKAANCDGEGKVLLLHCNVKNPFAQNADHSLSLGDEKLGGLMRAGWTLVIAHEHQYRPLRGGRVVITGNQIPTSVADMLGCDGKFYATIRDGVVATHRVEDVERLYAEIDWTDLDDAPDLPFLRVTGKATVEQAAEVVSAVANLRRTSDALVIGNAVRVEGLAEFDALAELSFEDVKKIDVLSMLLEELTEREQEIVKGLLSC